MYISKKFFLLTDVNDVVVIEQYLQEEKMPLIYRVIKPKLDQSISFGGNNPICYWVLVKKFVDREFSCK
jgi:hypothetical protein